MSFDNCTQAYKAGVANIPKGDPAYSSKLDRDHDGVACDRPPAGFKPRHETSTGTSTSTSTSTSTTVDNGGQLPKTGTGGEIGALGGLMLVVGMVSVALFRSRKVRFTS